jgi:hypothetical protein
MSEKMYYWGQEKDVDPDQTFIEFSAKQVETLSTWYPKLKGLPLKNINHGSHKQSTDITGKIPDLCCHFAIFIT